MKKNTIHFENLKACQICGNCIEQIFPNYYCAKDNDSFGNIRYPKYCDDFVEKKDEDEDDVCDDFNPKVPIDCPNCGNNAYWDGSCYVCNDCGWCGNSN